MAPPPAPRTLLSRWLLFLVPVLLATAWFGPALLFGPRVTGIAVTRGTSLRSVVATGRVTTPYRVAIGSGVASAGRPSIRLCSGLILSSRPCW